MTNQTIQSTISTFANTARMVGKIEHPKHGTYYLFFDGSCYGISKTEYNGENGLWCAYASLGALFKMKGL